MELKYKLGREGRAYLGRLRFITRRRVRVLEIGWLSGKGKHCPLVRFHNIKRPFDNRPRDNYGTGKWAINRDGDYYLVECPSCHRQCISRDKAHGRFICSYCDIGFVVYTEDGAFSFRDYREGNVNFPANLVWDEAGNGYLGLTEDAPWWWRRRDIYRDLRKDGKDGHGHQLYETVPLSRQEDDDRSEVVQEER